MNMENMDMSELMKLLSKMDKKDLEKGLKITDEKEKNAINEALISLQRQGKIYLNDKENYILFPREYRLAKLCMSRNGNAHISTDIGKIDISSEENIISAVLYNMYEKNIDYDTAVNQINLPDVAFQVLNHYIGDDYFIIIYESHLKM